MVPDVAGWHGEVVLWHRHLAAFLSLKSCRNFASEVVYMVGGKRGCMYGTAMMLRFCVYKAARNLEAQDISYVTANRT